MGTFTKATLVLADSWQPNAAGRLERPLARLASSKFIYSWSIWAA